MVLGELPLWFLRFVSGGLGLLFGSFLNVVIYRLPRDMSVVTPPSHCPGCGAPIRAWENIPVVSYLLQRGRARCCGVRISPRYPAVELVGGVVALALFESLIRPLPPGSPFGHAAALYGADFALTFALIAGAFIDAEQMILPDSITLGGAAFAFATSPLRDVRYLDSALAAACGFVLVWLPFCFIYPRIRGRQGMGLGDAKLLLLVGAWLGIRGAVVTLFAGALQATLFALLAFAVQGKIEEPEAVRADRDELEKAAAAGDEEAKAILAEDPLGKPPEHGIMASRIPFGPFLVLAALEMEMGSRWIRESAWGWMLGY